MKKAYQSPRLEELGTLEEVTQQGLTRPGQDTFDGSVVTPNGPPS